MSEHHNLEALNLANAVAQETEAMRSILGSSLSKLAATHTTELALEDASYEHKMSQHNTNLVKSFVGLLPQGTAHAKIVVPSHSSRYGPSIKDYSKKEYISGASISFDFQFAEAAKYRALQASTVWVETDVRSLYHTKHTKMPFEDPYYKDYQAFSRCNVIAPFVILGQTPLHNDRQKSRLLLASLNHRGDKLSFGPATLKYVDMWTENWEHGVFPQLMSLLQQPVTKSEVTDQTAPASHAKLQLTAKSSGSIVLEPGTQESVFSSIRRIVNDGLGPKPKKKHQPAPYSSELEQWPAEWSTTQTMSRFGVVTNMARIAVSLGLEGELSELMNNYATQSPAMPKPDR